MTQSEFSRIVRLDTLGGGPRSMAIEARPEERAALADRFGLAALDRLEARIDLVRSGEQVRAAGRVVADAAQACVVTGAPVSERIDERFEIRFRPETSDDEEEVELGEAELDVIFYDGGLIDVGEAVAQTLALNLAPYPRAAGSVEALKAAGVKDESEAGPFGALASLKEKLSK